AAGERAGRDHAAAGAARTVCRPRQSWTMMGAMPRIFRLSFAFTPAFALALAIAPAHAQSPSPAPAAPASAQAAAPAHPAAPPDVSSMDAILKAVYDVISGPAGQKRDWDRFRSLFYEGARLIPATKPADGPPRARVMTPDDYVTRASGNMSSQGFY